MAVEILTKEGCRLCSEGTNPPGSVSDHGSSIIYKSGADSNTDWFATLQPKTMSDPNRGMFLMLMPLGHLTNFADLHLNKELASKYGIATAVLSTAMQKVRSEEWTEKDGFFLPSQVVCGKCHTPENTQDHLHVKFYDFSGGVAQAFPVDNGWAGKQLRCFQGQLDKYHVTASPATKSPIPQERFDRLRSRLINICGNA